MLVDYSRNKLNVHQSQIELKVSLGMTGNSGPLFNMVAGHVWGVRL